MNSRSTVSSNNQTKEPVKPCVCLIDDNEQYVAALLRPLQNDFRIHPYLSSTAFLADFNRGLEPDVIVTDYKISDTSGVDLCRKILAKDKSIPVILISGWIDKNVAIEAIEAGIYRILEKPCSLEEFMNSLHDAFDYRTVGLLQQKQLRAERALSQALTKLVENQEARYTAAENKIYELEKHKNIPIDPIGARQLAGFVRDQNSLYKSISEMRDEIAHLEKSVQLVDHSRTSRPQREISREGPSPKR